MSFNTAAFRQFDHGYAVTSHSAQGLTADRVLAHLDTKSSRGLINQRLAYVAISRASEDAQIYTDDAATLGQRLRTDVTKSAALDFATNAEPQPSPTPEEVRSVQVHESTTLTPGLRPSQRTTPVNQKRASSSPRTRPSATS